jgi:hypothetical protein
MEEKKNCKYCAAILPISAKFCPWCGNFLTGQHLSQTTNQDELPYLEDELLDKFRGLFLPVTGKKILLAGIAFFVLIYFAGIAGGWSSPQSQTVQPISVPSATPTSEHSTITPTSTPKPSVSTGARDDKAAKLEEILTKQGKTVVTPFTKTVNENGNDVYTGTFKDGKYFYQATIEVCKSPTESASRFSEKVAQLKSKGFSTYGNTSKELWIGQNVNSNQSVEVKQFTGSDNTLYVSIMFARTL